MNGPQAHVLALIALLLHLSACPKTDNNKRAETTAINLWHTFNPQETETLDRILERIQQRLPHLRIQPTVIPFARAQNKFRHSAQRCTPGDAHVFRAEFPWVAELVEKKLILPVPKTAPRLSAFLAQAQDAARYRGRRWILPASLDCLALIYNRDLVRHPPKDLDHLVRIARRHTVDSSGRNADHPAFVASSTVRWGFYVRADAYWFLPFLWAFGGDLIRTDPPAVHIHREEAVRALSFYRDLIRRHHVAPPRPSPSNDYEDQMQRFGSGQLAMMVNGPWATSAILDRPVFKSHPEHLAVAPFPRGVDQRPAAPLSGHGWVVSRCARDRTKSAWEVAQALGDLESQVVFAARNSLLPACEAAYHDRRVKRNRFVTGFRAALSGARARPHHPAIARIFDDFTPAVQAVLLGDAKPEEALAGVARAWERLLDIDPKSPDSEGDLPKEDMTREPPASTPSPGGP